MTRFDTWTVDLGPNGYTQPSIAEPHGGGSVIIAYAVDETRGEIRVGTQRHAAPEARSLS